MNIVFDAETLRVGQSDLITAVVYFDFDGERQFPINKWSDFVVVIATWWLEELPRLSFIGAKSSFSFMDGPYWIDAVVTNNEISLSCVEDRAGSGVVFDAIVAFDELERAVFSFANEVSRACAKFGLVSKDLDDLMKALMVAEANRT